MGYAAGVLHIVVTIRAVHNLPNGSACRYTSAIHRGSERIRIAGPVGHPGLPKPLIYQHHRSEPGNEVSRHGAPMDQVEAAR